MDPLALDAREYRGTYKLIGGRLCLDFINTLAWPGRDREHDWFDPWTNVVDWSVATGLAEDSHADDLRRRYREDPDAATAALEVIRRHRHAVREFVAPLVQGERPDRPAIRVLNDLLRSTTTARQVDASTLTWRWAEPERLEDVTAPAILDAAELVVGGDHKRVGRCTCGWLFYDQSRNRSRRWCDMADCGSRDKSLRYYHRHRADS